MSDPEPVFLGHLRAPSGVVALLDMGLLGPWCVDPEAHRAGLGAAVARGPAPFVVAGLQGVALTGLPRDRELPVFGVRVEGGEFKGLWQAVFLEIQPGVPAARTVELGAVVVDTGRVLCADADALSAWVHEEPIDGLADFVFWGDGAAATAAVTGATDLGEGLFGWLDVPYDDAVEHGMDVEDHRDEHGLDFATDFRPHSHHHQLLSQMREAASEAGTLALGDAQLVGFFTMWGDGQFPVMLDLDAEGAPTRCGIYFATKQAMLALHSLRHASEFD
jgi:hypothetical protein